MKRISRRASLMPEAESTDVDDANLANNGNVVVLVSFVLS